MAFGTLEDEMKFRTPLSFGTSPKVNSSGSKLIVVDVESHRVKNCSYRHLHFKIDGNVAHINLSGEVNVMPQVREIGNVI